MFQRLKKEIRNYFGFTKSQTNGFLVLAAIMIIILLLPVIVTPLLPHFFKNKNNNTRDQQMLDSLIAVIEEKKQDQKAEYELFKFDPNQVDSLQMMRLGFPGFINQRIRNYRTSGGKFEIKKDLKKIYGFPESLYARVEDFIDIPEKRVTQNYSKELRKRENTKIIKAKKSYPPIKINSATAEELTRISGIGKVLSERIIKFRDKLGGFHSKEQLHEVYGLDSLVANRLKQEAVLESNKLKKISLRDITTKELAKHPYINWKTAKKIIHARDSLLKKNSTLKLECILSDSLYIKKIKPYLDY